MARVSCTRRRLLLHTLRVQLRHYYDYYYYYADNYYYCCFSHYGYNYDTDEVMVQRTKGLILARDVALLIFPTKCGYCNVKCDVR